MTRKELTLVGTRNSAGDFPTAIELLAGSPGVRPQRHHTPLPSARGRRGVRRADDAGHGCAESPSLLRMTDGIAGTVAFVVGGSRGLGADLAAALHTAGARTVAVSRHPAAGGAAVGAGAPRRGRPRGRRAVLRRVGPDARRAKPPRQLRRGSLQRPARRLGTSDLEGLRRVEPPDDVRHDARLRPRRPGAERRDPEHGVDPRRGGRRRPQRLRLGEGGRRPAHRRLRGRARAARDPRQLHRARASSRPRRRTR